MAKSCMKLQGSIMTGTNQLEMKMHDLNEKISKINHRLGRAEKLLERIIADNERRSNGGSSNDES